MNEARFARQTDLLSPEATSVPVTVIGAGATGSFTTLALAKMGLTNLTVYDYDTVEIHNLPNQFYRTADIGKPKVDALKEIVSLFEDTIINAKKELYRGQATPGIVIVAVDSMDARIEIWKHMRLNHNVKLFIDSRMGAEVMQLFSFDPCDLDACDHYSNGLFPSSEAIPVRCTAKSITYTVMAIASLITSQVKRYLMKEAYKPSIQLDMATMSLFAF